MKVKRNPDTEPSGKMGEAYKKQDKAPRKGVKADDADEYQNSSVDFQNMSVAKGRAYAEQAKAPQGRGNRGPSQADGGPVSYWDKSTPEHKAYEEQCHWGESDNNSSPSLGFKLSGQPAGYLGHFNQEKFLRQGHNDGPEFDPNQPGGGSDWMAAHPPREAADSPFDSNNKKKQQSDSYRDDRATPQPKPKASAYEGLEETLNKKLDPRNRRGY